MTLEQELQIRNNHITYLENLLKQNSINFTPLQEITPQNEEKQQETKEKPFQTNLNEQVLSKEQIERYSRQMLLEEIGYDGQKLISAAKILVVGAGGIGAPALLYLAGMGVGEIGIIDDDSVEESNLHRQVIHNVNRVGVNKAASAKKTLQQFNQRVKIETYEYRLNNQNANKIFSKYDIILDASDNPKTRYLVNDAAIINKKVLVSGSAIGWEGQLTVYGYNNGPCYRCLFPVSPKGSGVKSCGEAGVVGMIPGTIGLLEALEALKIILQREGVLSQQLLLFDGKRASFKKVKIRPRQKNCCVCGDQPTLTNVEEFDYEDFVQEICALNFKPKDSGTSYAQLKWAEFVDIYKNYKNNPTDPKPQFFDIRFKSQYNIVNFQQSEFENLPYDDIEEMKDEDIEQKFQKKAPIYLMCRRGINSQFVAQTLFDKGYTNVVNIKGGMEAYARGFDETIPFF